MEALPSDRGEGVKQRRLSCIGCGLVAKGEASGWRASSSRIVRSPSTVRDAAVAITQR